MTLNEDTSEADKQKWNFTRLPIFTLEITDHNKKVGKYANGSTGSFSVTLKNTSPSPSSAESQRCGNASSSEEINLSYIISNSHAAYRFNFTWSHVEMFSYLAIRFNGEPTKTRNDLLIERTTSGSLRMEDSGLMTVTMITRLPTTVIYFL